ncbi:MAG: ABC transporter ATP-binding protein [Phycisphaeraceae bacterium]|nr:MAG: ABC transporter ATP-binding protein [Phycisphaeraceae bacterium]
MLSAKSVSVRLRKWNASDGKWHWALRDIDLNLVEGDRLGVVGRNGSGKSTLCRVLAGILRPTEGSISSQGTVVPLLGFGAALQPELSGVQNVRLMARLMGCSVGDLENIQDEVVRETELGSWLHEPVGHYSTGMRARLAFIVATSISADVLLVDEALGAGDLAFRQRAMQRLTMFMQKARVLVMVSHQLQEIQKNCNKVVWMEDGMIRSLGETDDVLQQYKEAMHSDRESR